MLLSRYLPSFLFQGRWRDIKANGLVWHVL